MCLSYLQLKTFKDTTKWLVSRIDELLKDLAESKEPAKIKALIIEIGCLRQKCNFELKNINEILKKINDTYE